MSMPKDRRIVCRPQAACKAHAQDSGSRPSAVTAGSAAPALGLLQQLLPSRAGSASSTQGARTASPRLPPIADLTRARPGPFATPYAHRGPRHPTPAARRGAGAHPAPSPDPQPPRPGGGKGPRPSRARRCPRLGAPPRRPRSPRPDPARRPARRPAARSARPRDPV